MDARAAHLKKGGAALGKVVGSSHARIHAVHHRHDHPVRRHVRAHLRRRRRPPRRRLGAPCPLVLHGTRWRRTLRKHVKELT